MAILTGSYDPNAEASSGEFGALPAGEYKAQIVDSDMKPTKNNDGHYLELEYQVMGGEQDGRKVWCRLNLDNKNDTAVRIANEQFRSIRHATGVANPRDSVELHHKPHMIRVEFFAAGTTDRRGVARKSDQNEVKGWTAIEGGSQQTAPAASGGVAPWLGNRAA